MPYVSKPNTVNEIWASGGIVSQPTNLKISQGWTVEIPPYQFFNWSQNRTDAFVAHVNQMGIPVWDNLTEYQANKSYVQGSNGNIYKAKLTNTNLDPTSGLNTAQWGLAFDVYGSSEAVAANLATHLVNYGTLAGVSNYPQARTNLSVFSKSESDARFAPVAGNAAQTFSVANATLDAHAINRGQFNALLTTATETQVGILEVADQSEMNVGTADNKIVTPKKGDATYAKRSNNLSDLSSAATARTNLGLTTTATTALTDILLKAGNLSGLANNATARTNLGLGTIATENAIDWLSKSGNLAGLTNTSTARSNLGLGNSATTNVGTTVGTVAAGDDSRIVNAVPNTRQVVAGNGLTGGGALSGNVSVVLGVPSTISASTSNTVAAESHSHAFDIASFFGNRSLSGNGYYVFPGNFCIQWGTTGFIGGANTRHTQDFNIPFATCLFVNTGTIGQSTTGIFSNKKSELSSFTNTQFIWNSDTAEAGGGNIGCTWIALGTV
jgi:hypothetical protein